MEKFTKTKFTKAFHSAATEFALNYGLVINTNARQAKNGTISFYDTIGQCGYTIHPNGYVRRHTVGMFSKGCYQLNRKRIVPVQSRWTETVRIPATPSEQLGILATTVPAYRKNKMI